MEYQRYYQRNSHEWNTRKSKWHIQIIVHKSFCSQIANYQTPPALSFLFQFFWYEQKEDREKERERERTCGVARARLSEERKAWRKNHPLARFRPFLLSFNTSASFFPFFFLLLFALWCYWVPVNSSSTGPGNNRVSWQNQRLLQMGPWAWWFGVALFPAELALVLTSLTL